MKNSTKMNAIVIKTLCLSVAISCTLSCSNNKSAPPKAEETTQTTTVSTPSAEPVVANPSGDTQMLITSNAFRGIQVGDPITKHSAYTQKMEMKTAEGTFMVYSIKDFENNPAGYFMLDPQNKLLVGDIVVSTPKAQTAQGIKVGDTFQSLQKAIPSIEVNGSEIEGRTYATANNIAYRLDALNYSYKIDQAKIKATAKITEITIRRAMSK